VAQLIVAYLGMSPLHIICLSSTSCRQVYSGDKTCRVNLHVCNSVAAIGNKAPFKIILDRISSLSASDWC